MKLVLQITMSSIFANVIVMLAHKLNDVEFNFIVYFLAAMPLSVMVHRMITWLFGHEIVFTVRTTTMSTQEYTEKYGTDSGR